MSMKLPFLCMHKIFSPLPWTKRGSWALYIYICKIFAWNTALTQDCSVTMKCSEVRLWGSSAVRDPQREPRAEHRHCRSQQVTLNKIWTQIFSTFGQFSWKRPWALSFWTAKNIIKIPENILFSYTLRPSDRSWFTGIPGLQRMPLNKNKLLKSNWVF